MTEPKSILLRINPKLWAQLQAWSKDELRSLNSQIEYILRDAVRKRKGQSSGDADLENSDKK
ncbi:Arc family DNA binding domain-containing protein [Planctomycetota bacterium]